ncbi:BTAD domain-containing putative transcriptional regulator [Streptomyces sp. NPDC059783]|uniref:AfsR/SARP family transcriptional regulator n=1 Tax=Streptomyces sp. NPDC059783 TaxID=3346944 RepID=UPI00364AC9A1
MDIQILGPVGLRLNGQWLALGSDKERMLLAALALDAGRPVAIGELIERLWDGDPPVRARENTHTYVSRLRRKLRLAGTGPDAPVLDGRSHTYTLITSPDTVDRRRFQRLVDTARTEEDDARAVASLARADALWQGEALAGLPGFWAATVRRTLAESRLAATTSRLAAGLRLGRYAEQIPELAALADAHPGDETLLGLLMVAYYGSGRYGDALRVHQRARKTLMAEYGALPGAELNLIHQGVLARVPARELVEGGGGGRAGGGGSGSGPAAGSVPVVVGGAVPVPAPVRVPIPDPDPDPAPVPRPAGAGDDAASPAEASPGETSPPRTAPAQPVAPPVPVIPPRRNLPVQPALVGRRAELRALFSALGGDGSRDGSVVTVEAVSGMAGVGKTALAVATAELLAERYPAGQLYIDLRGHSPTGEPLTARAALATLLRLLGASASSIPPELEGRTALWRTMMAERRMVIVLDDATGPEQVEPLLPSGSPSLTIIASRRHLTGIPHALSVPLDALPEEDAIALFRGFAGEERTRDTMETRRIVRLCGCLPLAIELVAHRFRARTSWTLTVLAERLARGPGRLAEIHSADQEQEMARAFALSYRTLTPPQRTAFRRLGLHPGPDFTAAAAAALLGTEQDEAERVLEALLACHLLREPVPDRYRFHDLLREYAAGLAASEDGEEDRRQAVDRLTAFYVVAADRADRMAYPRRVRPAPPTPPPPLPPPLWPDSAAARAWLTAEHANLLAVEDHARRNGAPGPAARLAYSVAGFLQTECHWQDATRLLDHAVAHWDRADGGHPSELRHALIDLCAANASIGEYADAATAGERALDLARASGDAAAEGEALRVLGTLSWHLGNNRQALVLLQNSLAIKSLSGDIWDKARSRNNVAVTLLFLGEHDRALSHFHSALSGFQAAHDKIASAQALNNIGELQLRIRELDSARRSFEESLSFLDVDGSRYDRATVRRNLAETLMESGEISTALSLFRTALAEFLALGDRKSIAETLGGLGEAHWRLGNVEESNRHMYEALGVAQAIGAAHHEIQALRRLARADLADGRYTLATERLRAAITAAIRTSDITEETAARTLLAETRLAAGDAIEARTALRHAFELTRRRDPAAARRISRRLGAIERAHGTRDGKFRTGREE